MPTIDRGILAVAALVALLFALTVGGALAVAAGVAPAWVR